MPNASPSKFINIRNPTPTRNRLDDNRENGSMYFEYISEFSVEKHGIYDAVRDATLAA